MATRYEGEGDEPDSELVDEVNTFDLNETGKGFHGKLSTLLEWHKQDPVDSFEINRNNVIYSYQENRNPLIDHPESVESVWGNVTSTGYFIKQELKIYPNPTTDYLHVILPYDAEANGVMYSMMGNKVAEFSGKGKITVKTSDLDSGCYCVRTISNEKVYQSKIIIQ